MPTVSAIRERLLRFLYDVEDRSFDARHRITTRGFISLADLATESEYRSHATSYQSTWCSTIRTLLRQCFAVGYRPAIFIDIGCGKGKACFYAAVFGRFSAITGIDFDASLIAQARANAESFVPREHAPIEFLHEDASRYSLGDCQSLVFLFNPFDETVLRLFVAGNLASLKQNGHVIAYANDLHRSVLLEFGLEEVFGDRRRNISLWTFRGVHPPGDVG